MSPRQVLREALPTLMRAHTSTQLAEDTRGRRVNPRSPRAVAWSSIGVLYTVAPLHPNVTADRANPGHLPVAWDAAMLLDKAAREQGYPNTVEVDRAGTEAAYLMYLRAIDSAPTAERRRPTASVGTGGSPRGVEAA